jgi:hypothetical protein
MSDMEIIRLTIPEQKPLPIERVLRAKLEANFARDLSSIRTRVVPQLAEHGIWAAATGGEIWLHDPLAEDYGTLRHEITHLFQQSGGERTPSRSGWYTVYHDARAERLADESALEPLGLSSPAPGTSLLQPIKMSIGACEYPDLLTAMDNATTWVQGFAAAPAWTPEPRTSAFSGTLDVTDGAHWPNLGVQIKRRLPCHVRVNGGTPINIALGQGNQGLRLDFPITAAKKDLNYQEVQQGLTALVAGNHAVIARLILDRVQGKNVDGGLTTANLAWLDALIILMFAVEGSRFPAALVTSVLFLDLVAQGKVRASGKVFTFDNAFHTNLDWEDGSWYGGKFPYATHGTGTGNNWMRAELKADNGLAFQNHFEQMPQRHCVPRREITLLIHWLECRQAQSARPYLNSVAIQRALQRRLKVAYLTKAAPPVLPNNSLNTGVTSFGYAKFAKIVPPTNGNAWVYCHNLKPGLGSGVYYHSVPNAYCGRQVGHDPGLAQLTLERTNFTFATGKPINRKGDVPRQEHILSDTNLRRIQLYQATRWGLVKCPKCFL